MSKRVKTGLMVAGLAVVLIWFLQKAKTQAKVPASGAKQGREPLITVTIDDPGMEYAPQFNPPTAWSDYD